LGHNSDNVHRLELGSKQIILIGTAHVSPQSVEDVKEIIQTEKPDTVCVELCKSRYLSIIDNDKWNNTDIVQIIKEGRSLLLLINLILSSYQKKIARQCGVQPGQEMLQGITSADDVGANLCLADREIQITMLRLWRRIGFVEKVKLLLHIVLMIFDNTDLNEEDLKKIKSQDMLTAALNELSKLSPRLKSVLIDERDQYMAEKIKTATGNKVVAVLGAGHIPGIKKELYINHDLTPLTKVPPSSRVIKIIAWAIPVLILLFIGSTFSVDRQTGVSQLTSWIAWTGTLSALGALIALGHPLSILTAFITSPIASLLPSPISAGLFAGTSEVLLKKPQVQDFEHISKDIYSLQGFWRNKVTHILLVAVLASVGSTIGAVIGGADVLRHFFQTFF